MFIFKILLIILIALPVIALATYFYLQMLSYIRVRNDIEDQAIKEGIAESKAAENSKKGRKKNKKKEKKEKQK